MLATAFRRIGLFPLYIEDLFEGSSPDLDGEPTSTGDGRWAALAGTSMGKGGGQASGSGEFAIYVVNTVSPRYRAEMVIDNPSSKGGDCLYFRVVDADNWWRVRYWQDSAEREVQLPPTYYHQFMCWTDWWDPPPGPGTQGVMYSETFYDTITSSSPQRPSGNPPPPTLRPPQWWHSKWVYRGVSRVVPGAFSTVETGVPTVVVEKSVDGVVTGQASREVGTGPLRVRINTTPQTVEVNVNGEELVGVIDGALSAARWAGIGRGPSSYDTRSGIREFRAWRES